MTASHDFLDNLGNHQHQKMLREIANDAITPKKRDSKVQNDLYRRWMTMISMRDSITMINRTFKLINNYY